MTTGEGPCVISGTEVLTRSGWKIIDDCTIADEIASINPTTGVIEYCYPNEKLSFDVTGPMCHFKSGMLDHCVTPNHRCWVKGPQKDDYVITLAENIGSGYKFKSVVGWNGFTQDKIIVPGYSGDTNKYLKFIGLYLSEGSLEYNGITPASIRISQTKKHKFGINPRYADVKSAILDFAPEVKEHQRTYVSGDKGHFEVHNTEFAKHVLANYSEGSANKHIPINIKSLAKEHLEYLLHGCFLGDGSKYGQGKSYEIYTISRQLADDLQEIALKCGYATKIITKKRDSSRQTIYRVIVLVDNGRGIGREPEVRTANIHIFNYTGKVFSFDLPINKIYVTRRNGLVTITGNTFANAQVAYEVLQKRYVFFRNIIEKWLYNKVFYPVAIAQKFIDPATGKYILPQIRWNRIDFNKDDTWRQLILQLNGAQNKLISDRTVVTELGLDYEEEQTLITQEKVSAKARRQQIKEQGAPGGELGAGGMMGGIGGGIGGGMPGLPPMGGALPPMPGPGAELGGAGGMTMPGGEGGATAPPPPPAGI